MLKFSNNIKRPIIIIIIIIIIGALGSWIFGSFSGNASRYIDKTVQAHLYELLNVAEKPYSNRLLRAKNNMMLIEEYVNTSYPGGKCQLKDLKTYLEYAILSSGLDDILFLNKKCEYLSSAGERGILDITNDLVTLFGKDETVMRYLNWNDGDERYVVAAPVHPLTIDGEVYEALVALYTPKTMNELFNVRSFEEHGALYVLDNTGVIIFTNEESAVRGSNYLSQYRANNMLTEKQVEDIKKDFTEFRQNTVSFEKDGEDMFLCYKPSEGNIYNFVLEVPADKARSALTDFRAMIFRTVAGIGVILIIAMLVLFFMLYTNSRNKALAAHEKKNNEKLSKLNQELDRARDEAETASKAKSTFLNNMSHDIRTPMNAIVGFTNLALGHMNNQEQVADYLKKIKKSSAHLLSLINDVLDMSRIEAGKMSLELQSESMTDILQTLKNIVDGSMSKKHHHFQIINNTKHDHIFCDRLRLNQILLNLLSNSVKYTNNGGEISLTINEEDTIGDGMGRYIFRVKDNGIGMTKEFAEKVFDQFTREKNSTMSGVQGTGLGMAITKRFVDMMGGTIDIETEKDKGTEFIVGIDFELDLDAEKNSAVEDDVERFHFKGKKVLLVEDNELNLEIATMILEEEGFDIDTARDGEEAVEKIRHAEKGDYDIVLMDIQMPKMNGYQATRAIRAMSTQRDKGWIESLPIVAMTANAFEEDKKEAYESGMNDHVAKPIEVDILKRTIAKYMD